MTWRIRELSSNPHSCILPKLDTVSCH